MKRGDEMRESQGLETSLKRRSDLTGRRWRISVTRSSVSMSPIREELEVIVG